MRKIFLFGLFLILFILLIACNDDTPEETSESIDETVELTKDEEEGDDGTKKNSNKETKENREQKKNEKQTLYADSLIREVDYFTDGQDELREKSYKFIVENHTLFPAKDKKDIIKANEKAEIIDVRKINKSIDPYLTTIVKLEGYVVEVEEKNYENEETAAFVNLIDEDWYNHHIIFYKTTGDILEEDYVQITGLPIAKYNYETLDGGSQNAIVYFGSHIKKY